MIALEAKYHHKCLVNLYSRARALDRATQGKDNEADSHGIAFAELVTHMEDFQKEDIAPVFKLTDLIQIYSMKIGFNNLVLLLKAIFILPGSKTGFCLHFQIFKCIMKAIASFSAFMNILVLH